ncbi:hypothetical protein FSP39_002008 [Pinctada imbricata]|uniref:C-type lectin domain-containing protein n=1 Tax=Pinctada imbricata TaxID=66713 RepID=A0AA88Y716_PINIB|nr:hypothetical protein FSP39_002008 [Pinctada imbricata]
MDHPTKHQMLLLVKRKFYALDLSQAIDRVCDSCHTCASLQKVPTSYIEQSSDLPPEVVGVNFAADVIKQNRQLIFVLRETVTSFTAACIISNEKSQTLRDALLRLCMELHPLDGPHAVVRVDPAPGFIALREDDLLKYHLSCNYTPQGDYPSTSFWVDGSDILVEGDWTWVRDVTPLGYTDWSTGQPSYSGATKNCMEVVMTRNATWSDDNCEKMQSFICERE